ncbi:MAG: 6-carboxytetrahydropterin synthase [Candidatus Dormiibacterota bacterium]
MTPSSPVLRVCRRESFDAAHQLCDPRLSSEENRALYGKCVNLHGHRYQLEVVVAGDMDEASGYVVDLKQLADVIRDEIIQHVDHHNLNSDVAWLAGRIPTAETLAMVFFERLQPRITRGTLYAVRVWETEKNWAECTRSE